MEFTEAYKQTGPCCFSPNSRYIAVAVDYRLVIRDTLSFKVLFLFQFTALFEMGGVERGRNCFIFFLDLLLFHCVERIVCEDSNFR